VPDQAEKVLSSRYPFWMGRRWSRGRGIARQSASVDVRVRHRISIRRRSRVVNKTPQSAWQRTLSCVRGLEVASSVRERRVPVRSDTGGVHLLAARSSSSTWDWAPSRQAVLVPSATLRFAFGSQKRLASHFPFTLARFRSRRGEEASPPSSSSNRDPAPRARRHRLANTNTGRVEPSWLDAVTTRATEIRR
jgi:hypothetical protein